jgi:exodeoxyribonuclease V alpha subunit
MPAGHGDLFARLAESAFRSKFKLSAKDHAYIASKGMATIEKHAADFIAFRIAPAQPRNDGRQTPLRGHPVFVAQHATATCCRGCIAKWHGIAKGGQLSAEEQRYLVEIILAWLDLSLAPDIE